MALSSSTLGSLILSELTSGPFDSETGLNAIGIPEEENDKLEAFCDRLAAAIVSHITDDAEVDVTVPASGLLDGGGLPCTGSADGSGGIS